MSVVINPKKEDAHQLSKTEAWEFFNAAVKERLSISAEEFLKDKEKYKQNPHYESLVFLLPLINGK